MSLSPEHEHVWSENGVYCCKCGARRVGQAVAEIIRRAVWEARDLFQSRQRHNHSLAGALINRTIDAVLAARSEGSAVPLVEGWVMVPREPTEAMLAAAETALSDWRKTLDRDEAMMRSYQAHDRKFIASATPAEKHAIRYRAMIAAAPNPGADHV